MDNKIINIEELLYLFKKRIKALILCLVVCMLASGYFAYKMQPSYEARVKIFAGKTEDIQSNYSKDEIADYQSLVGSYIEIIKTEDFMNKVIKKADLNLQAKDLLNGIQINTAASAPVMTISYKASDSETAEKVVTALSTEFEAGVQEVILNTYTKIIDSVKVTTYEPNKIKVVLLGIIAGIVIGIGLVLVLDYLDDTVVRKEELEKLLGIPVLGEISVEDAKGEKHKKSKRRGKRFREEI